MHFLNVFSLLVHIFTLSTHSALQVCLQKFVSTFSLAAFAPSISLLAVIVSGAEESESCLAARKGPGIALKASAESKGRVQ